MIKQKFTLIKGDGIGPEITEAVLNILNAANVDLEYEEAIVGEKIYHQNISSGIDAKAWEIIKRNPIMLKAPITTPTGGGYKSLNVTLRKELGLYINLRPAITYYPIIENSPKIMDVIIIRENEEDLYAGIEYRQTNDSFTSLKLLTKAGSLKICHFAFEYAKSLGRKKVTCMIKDNIMKISDGMFYESFLEVAKNYKEIEADRYIIDIGAARLACKPYMFDIVVTENLYGDIISDITSEVAGSVGLAGSSNIGTHYAMFEAIHGSAPGMAPNTANPTALLNAALLMLEYLNMNDKANLIKNALLKTLEDGLHTKDLYQENKSKAKLGTKEFSKAIIERLGQKPIILKPSETNNKNIKLSVFDPKIYNDFLNKDKSNKKLVGVDLFIDLNINNPADLANKIQKITNLKLTSIMSRGLKVWPNNEMKKIELCDHWMCRFLDENITHNKINESIVKLTDGGLDIIKIEKLYNFGDRPGFSAGQGE